MNPLQLGAFVSVLLATAAWCTAHACRRAPASLAAARRQMYGSPVPTLASASWSSTLADGSVGGWVARRYGAGLRVVGLTVADVVTRAMTSVTLMGFTVLGSTAALMTMGLLPPSPLWLLLAPVVAAAAGWIVLHDVADRITRAHRQYRRTTNDFIQLVAVGLTTDQSVEEAVGFALSVGAGDAFDALRRAVSQAPLRGVPMWEALDAFGRDHDVRELREFATSLERQGLQGVSIAETVASMATAMRAKALDDLEREADKANANLSGPTIGFVVSTIVFLAYPLAQRITDAFGG